MSDVDRSSQLQKLFSFVMIILTIFSVLSFPSCYCSSEFNESPLKEPSTNTVYMSCNISIQDIDIDKKIANVSIFIKVENLTNKASQVKITFFQWAYFNTVGYNYVDIICDPLQSIEETSSTNSFEGNVTNIQWSIQGIGELYPFDYYTIEFHVGLWDSYYVEEEQRIKIDSLVKLDGTKVQSQFSYNSHLIMGTVFLGNRRGPKVP